MKPNIVYIHSHDTGRYVQPYGHAIPTPNIQRLAEQGVLFRQAFCAAPTCSPSRASLLTGQWAHCSGMLGLAHRGWALNDCGQHLVSTLKAAGYHTALSGMQHVTWPDATVIGYDAVIGECEDAESRAVEYLDGAPAQPFFLDVGFFETHRRGPGFDPQPEGKPPTDARFVKPPPTLPDTAETRADMAAYIDSARALDAKMGLVFDALDRNGLTDSTLVICTTDHGIAFPGCKCNLTDHGMGVMLIMRGPGGFAGGQAIDAMVSQVDLFPTICDVVDIERPEWLQGESMMPLLSREAVEIRDELFAEATYHAAYEPMRAVRTKRWKYIRRFDGRDKPVLPNCDDGASKDAWMAAGWRPPEAEQLFDLTLDPNETRNVIDEAGVADQMRDRLDRWMRETDDPLLKGPVPLPEGGVINDADGISPTESPK